MDRISGHRRGYLAWRSTLIATRQSFPAYIEMSWLQEIRESHNNFETMAHNY